VTKELLRQEANRIKAYILLTLNSDGARGLRGRLVSGALWTFIGAAGLQFFRLLASVPMGRILGPESFGGFGIIQTTIGMFGTFAGMGLGVTATRHVAEYRLSDPDRAGRIMGMSLVVAAGSGLLLAILLWCFAHKIAIAALNAPSLEPQLRMAAAILLFSALNGAQLGSLTGLEAFRSSAIASIFQGGILIPCLVLGALSQHLPGAVLGLVVATAASCLFSGIWLRKACRAAGLRIHYRPRWSELRLLGTYSFPVLLSSVLVVPVNWFCSVMLAQQVGGYRELRVFNAANQLRYAILFVPTVLSQFALPILSNLHGQGSRAKYRKVLVTQLGITTAAASLTAVPLALAAPIIMHLYGREFVAGAPVLCVLVFSTVLAAVNSVIGTAIFSAGLAYQGLLFNLLWAGALLIGANYLVVLYHAEGLAWATLIAYALHTVWQLTFLMRHLRSSARHWVPVLSATAGD